MFVDGVLGEFSLEVFCKLAKGILICCINALLMIIGSNEHTRILKGEL